MKRRVPRLTTDEEAEAFLASDLSDVDFSQFKSGRLRFEEGAGSKPKTPSGMNPVRQRAIDRLRCLVLDALGNRDAKVYLFGSHARGDVRHASDIDVAILPGEELPPVFFARLAESIEESTIPYEVDLMDLRKVSPAFRDEVVRTGIKWRD
jgi:predicted nucleotidyltransferase